MDAGIRSLAVAALASFIVGALTVITDLWNRPIDPVYLIVGGAALCGALWETVRLMTRPNRHLVTRRRFHERARRTGWLSDRSADREARTDQAAFLANPAPRVGRVDDYGTAHRTGQPTQPPPAPRRPRHDPDDPRAAAWDRRHSVPAHRRTRARLHALSDPAYPDVPHRAGD